MCVQCVPQHTNAATAKPNFPRGRTVWRAVSADVNIHQPVRQPAEA